MPIQWVYVLQGLQSIPVLEKMGVDALNCPPTYDWCIATAVPQEPTSVPSSTFAKRVGDHAACKRTVEALSLAHERACKGSPPADLPSSSLPEFSEPLRDNSEQRSKADTAGLDLALAALLAHYSAAVDIVCVAAPSAELS